MTLARRVAPLLASALLVALSGAQGVGSRLPSFDLKDFALTPATSLDDFGGRALLIEFFAHW